MASRRGRPAAEIVLTDEQRDALCCVVRAETGSRRDVRRAQVILAAADGEGTIAITARLHHSTSTVARWRKRFSANGMAGLLDRPRSGRRPRITPVQRCEIIAAACQPPPQEDGVTGWTRARLREAILQQGIVNPPKDGVVVCIDEKTGMQAIERKHPDGPATHWRRRPS